MIEEIYERALNKAKWLYLYFVPYFRRFIRFIAMPYCYFGLVNWEICNKSPYQVFKDLWFIFFKMKTFPDFYSPCRLWELDREHWFEYYGSVYDPYRRMRLNKAVQRPKYQVIFDDKEICHNLFCKANNLPVTDRYATIDLEDDYRKIISEVLNKIDDDKIIIKPVDGQAGRGIVIANKAENHIYIKTEKNEIPLDRFKLKQRSVLEKIVVQHHKISEISPNSLNTIRIVTLLTKNSDVLIVGALMRFSAGEGFVDNWSAGGLAVGIDIQTGVLKKFAYDKYAHKYKIHPVSQFTFQNFEIPFWPEVNALAEQIQSASTFYKMLGLDIAVTEKGPLLIELNSQPGNISIEQTFGPILHDDKIRKAFEEYKLLL